MKLLLFTLALVAVMLTVSAPQDATAQGVRRFAIDANLDNGVCDPVDSAASVGQDGTFRVAVCALNVVPPEAFTVDVGYDTAYLSAPEVPGSASALDDNPDANAGLTTFGSQTLGNEWDCTTFGLFRPKGDDPATPGGNAKINCNANLGHPERALSSGAMVVITFHAGTGAAVTNLRLLQDTTASEPVGNTDVTYGCLDPTEAIPCDNAAITITGAIATPTPVSPTPGPTEAARATATRVTFDATQSALPVGARQGGAPVVETSQALEGETPSDPAAATSVASAIDRAHGTATALAGVEIRTTNGDKASAGTDANTDSAPDAGSNGSNNTAWVLGGVVFGVLLVGAGAAVYWRYRGHGRSLDS